MSHPGLWKIDPARSELRFDVRFLLFSHSPGRFRSFQGDIEWEAGALDRARVAFAVEVASVQTEQKIKDEHLQSAEFFDAGRWPFIRFASNRVEAVGSGDFRCFGDLEMHGAKHPVTLEGITRGIQEEPDGTRRAAFSAHGVLDRKDFGIVVNTILDHAGFVVGNRVRFDADVEATRSNK